MLQDERSVTNVKKVKAARVRWWYRTHPACLANPGQQNQFRGIVWNSSNVGAITERLYHGKWRPSRSIDARDLRLDRNSRCP